MPDVPCYKQKQYGDWCQGEQTLRAENAGYYCIFHLPKGVNEKGSAALKTGVFQRINDAKGSGKACNLSGTVFNDDISFSQFNKDDPMPEVDFSYAVFHGQADFRDVVFEGMASFGWATFEKDAYFNSAIFKKKGAFFCTVFKEDALFLYAEFSEKADFTEILFEGEAVFIKKTFLKGADFLASDTKRRIVFDRVDLSRVSLLDCDLRKVDFINCNFAKVEGNRRALYDELVVRNKVPIDKEEEEEEDDDEPAIGKIERVEILYRRLKQKYLEERDYGQASEWHIREKGMWKKRTSIKDFLSFTLLWLYDASSEYGENPGRALLFLILMICSTAWLLSICGMTMIGGESNAGQMNWPSNMDLNKMGQLFVSVFQYLTFQKDFSLKPISIGGDFVKLLSQILIPLQAALFGLAVRNRFRR